MDNSKNLRKIGHLEEKAMWINVDNFVDEPGLTSYILELSTKRGSYPQVIHRLLTMEIDISDSV